MTIHPDFTCCHDEDRLVRNIDAELDGVHEKKRDGRNRILRYGWSYENPKQWLRDIPGWILSWDTATETWRKTLKEIGHGENLPDSVAVNEYTRLQIISPHTDSPAFGDVAILSLLADTIMRFTSSTGEVRDFLLPRYSLAIVSGELRNSWRHETLPLEADRRISVVYRKRLT